MSIFTQEALLAKLKTNEQLPVILDTDAYNEVDDQFCIAHAMRSSDRIRLLSLNAAPFFNDRSASPADGMEKSYQEIFQVMKLTDPSAELPVYRGSCSYLPDRNTPVPSEAADNIVNTVKNSEEPIIILAIGAITNVASAILQAPEIVQKCGVIWLGGHALQSPHNREFNLWQDVPAAQVVFDSSIPLVQIPCMDVCDHLLTSVAELSHYLKGKNGLCDYLVDNVAEACCGRFAASRIIWDLSASALLTCPRAFDLVAIPRPIVTSDSNYAFDAARPTYGYVRNLKRDLIFADLFQKL